MEALCFHVAEKIGTTVLDVKTNMTLQELLAWGDWFNYKARAREEAMKEAERKGGSGRSRGNPLSRGARPPGRKK